MTHISDIDCGGQYVFKWRIPEKPTVFYKQDLDSQF